MTDAPVASMSDDELALALAPLLWASPESPEPSRIFEGDVYMFSADGTQLDYPHPVSGEGMFEVLEAMHAKGWWGVMKTPFTRDGQYSERFSAGFTPLGTTGWNGRPDHRAVSERLERAVAEAALLALTAEAHRG